MFPRFLLKPELGQKKGVADRLHLFEVWQSIQMLAYRDSTNKEHIRHILRYQVYSITRIIYLIATNYMLGFDEELKAATHHFVQADAAEASKNGTLKELVDQCFG